MVLVCQDDPDFLVWVSPFSFGLSESIALKIGTHICFLFHLLALVLSLLGDFEDVLVVIRVPTECDSKSVKLGTKIEVSFMGGSEV